MDMKWTYLLIIMIYVVLVSIKLMNHKFINNFIRSSQNQPIKFIGFKKDFYSSIAIISTIATIVINFASGITKHPFNYDSIIVTVLLIGMAVLSGITTMYVGQDDRICISGYILKKGDVKTIEKKRTSNLYEIIFNEAISGYENLVIHILGSNKESFEGHISKFINE